MATRSTDLRLFLDVRPLEMENYPEPNGDTIMIFIKYFNAEQQELCGLERFYVQREMQVGDLSKMIHQNMGWPWSSDDSNNDNHSKDPIKNRTLKYFEEIKPGRIEPMKPVSTFAQNDMKDGDIICFQEWISDKE
jgi:ubiquitin carboxyl-terminal hydrolase 7